MRSWNEKPCNALGKSRKSKIEVRRSYDILADLDMNFVFGGAHVVFVGFSFFTFCFQSENLGLQATAKVVEFLKLRLWRFFAIEFRLRAHRGSVQLE